MVIWKEKLQLCTSQGIKVPAGAQLLCVQMQDDDEPYIWFLCNPAAEKEFKTIVMVGTGQNFNTTGMTYISTVQDKRGFVWHFFEA